MPALVPEAVDKVPPEPRSASRPSQLAALPSFDLAQLQNAWLYGARSRLLRTARIHLAEHILDLACGWGQVTLELAERTNASVTGIDLNAHALEYARNHLPGPLKGRVDFTLADAVDLPLENQTQDIIFVQCGMLWLKNKPLALAECRRVLKPTGCLVMIEPDYGGLMEFPPEISCRDVWTAALEQAGADPAVGRKLPALCQSSGFECHAYFLDRYYQPHAEYLSFLKELPLTSDQSDRVQQIEMELAKRAGQQIVIHLPFWLLVARPSSRPSSFVHFES